MQGGCVVVSQGRAQYAAEQIGVAGFHLELHSFVCVQTLKLLDGKWEAQKNLEAQHTFPSQILRQFKRHLQNASQQLTSA